MNDQTREYLEHGEEGGRNSFSLCSNPVRVIRAYETTKEYYMLETLIRLNEESLANLYQQKALKKTIQDLKGQLSLNSEFGLDNVLSKTKLRLSSLQARWAHVYTEIAKVMSDDQ